MRLLLHFGAGQKIYSDIRIVRKGGCKYNSRYVKRMPRGIWKRNEVTEDEETAGWEGEKSGAPDPGGSGTAPCERISDDRRGADAGFCRMVF